MEDFFFRKLDEQNEWEITQYSCYFMLLIRLFSLLFDHVQQQISNAYFLLLVVDRNINHIALQLTMVLSPSPFFQYYLLNCKSNIPIWIIHILLSFEEFVLHYYGLKINKE